MSYVLADVNGVLDDFASIGGMRDFSNWALASEKPVLRHFVEVGVTEDIAELREELKDTDSPPPPNVIEQFNVLVSAADRAEDVLIISDGTSDEDEPRTAGVKEGPLHATADKWTPKVEVLFRYAFAAARRVLTGKNKVNKALLVLKNELEESLPPLLKKIYVDGGVVGAKMLSRQLRNAEFRAAKRTPAPRIDFDFDVKTQAAIDWADRHAAELITAITETSRERINNAVAELLETGDWDELKDEILDAVGDSERARLIARNEPMIAVHEGQREAWDQAVEEGLMTGDEEREWIVVGDEKVCPICNGLDGKRAKLGQSYIGDDGEAYEGPPAHVSCRCSEGIV